ncbi:FISUMP domain-containing protein [Fibrobacter sp.]|uniref:FISUMP domain-containing protein n=1 Tax=Fibrobacter sp. TaxID=35828 RepID=UPI00388E2359
MKIFTNVIASPVRAKQSIFGRLVFALVFACIFIACGGDSSSSSVSPDPRPCEDQNEDCDDTSSSSEKISKNSSSSQKSVDKGKSSSSEKNAKESSSSATTKNSSSSVSDDKSSSSVKKEDSSSSVVKSSSSEAKSSSSEEVKQSSSSVVPSSSANSSSSAKAVMGGPCEKNGLKKIIGGVHAECADGIWVPYVAPSSSSTPKSSSSRGYKSLANPLHYNMSYGEFTDSRDGTKYATIDIDNEFGPDSVHLAFTVFAQNLKYHDKMVLGTEEQDDDTKVEMYCYNDSIEYCNDWWGGLYQWAEMMALPYECNSKNCADLIDTDGDGFHQGICPSGWHVMTQREFLAASYTSGGDKYLENRMSSLASEVSYSNGFGINTSGMSFIATGFRNHLYGYNHEVFEILHDITVLNFPKEYPSKIDRCAGGGVSRESSTNAANYKSDGASVRCVKDY